MTLDVENPLQLGGRFVLDGDIYTTNAFLSLRQIIATRHHDGEKLPVDVYRILQSSLQRAQLAEEGEMEAAGTEELPEADLDEANRRHGQLKLLIEAEKPTRKLAAEIAKSLDTSIATVYRWRLAYLKGGRIADLAPHRPTGGRGKGRIDPSADAIVDEVIGEFYLSNQKPTVSKVQVEVEKRCRRAKIKAPHESTLRRRIDTICEREKARARDGARGVKKYDPVPGRYPNADVPNAVWQIDHTPADICIVDDVYRRNIGRCWLTVAIDVFSRCIVGLYVSLDKPNATSVGMCLVNAILPKDGWLQAHGIAAPWDVWGKPRTVHADNDKTFRCETVTQAAKEHRINLEWRPVRKPRWGGHIERLLGTLNREVHTLPGTTFSNPLMRGDYMPHEEAQLTFAEFERYLIEWICGVYHVDFHSNIKRTPISKYQFGILGDGNVPGIGFPEIEKDPARLLLDFLPLKRATVQSDGIRVNNIRYYDPVIDTWMHAMDAATGKKRKFVCRQDPRDISVLWFLDPDKNRYFKIPYRNPEYPSITLWEYNAVRAQLIKEGHQTIDEELIFETYDRLDRIRQESSDATQTVRKAEQKKRVNEKKANAERAQVEAAHVAAGGAESSVVEASTAAPASRGTRSTAISKRAMPLTPSKSSTALPDWDDDEEVPRFRESV